MKDKKLKKVYIFRCSPDKTYIALDAYTEDVDLYDMLAYWKKYGWTTHVIKHKEMQKFFNSWLH